MKCLKILLIILISILNISCTSNPKNVVKDTAVKKHNNLDLSNTKRLGFFKSKPSNPNDVISGFYYPLSPKTYIEDLTKAKPLGEFNIEELSKEIPLHLVLDFKYRDKGLLFYESQAVLYDERTNIYYKLTESFKNLIKNFKTKSEIEASECIIYQGAFYLPYWHTELIKPNNLKEIGKFKGRTLYVKKDKLNDAQRMIYFTMDNSSTKEKLRYSAYGRVG